MIVSPDSHFVMTKLVPAIHDLKSKTWMPGRKAGHDERGNAEI
jgi:hypothetical protein